MRPIILLTASALALTAAACGQAPKPRAALDCPATQGDLTRTGVAADRKSCTYVSDDGAEVTLQLVAVQGGPSATLDTIETKLLAEAATLKAAEPAAEAAAAKADAQAPAQAQAEAPAASGTARDAAAVEREARADASGAGVPGRSGNVDVDLDVDVGGKSKGDGIVVEDGDRVRVNLPGIQVEADESTDSARVRVGPIRVDAGDENVTFRNGPRSVRLKGEALNPDKRGIRATFIYTGEKLPGSYRYVGYEAGGPKTGPLTVAVVKGKSSGSDHGHIAEDVIRLVRRNGGV